MLFLAFLLPFFPLSSFLSSEYPLNISLLLCICRALQIQYYPCGTCIFISSVLLLRKQRLEEAFTSTPVSNEHVTGSSDMSVGFPEGEK